MKKLLILALAGVASFAAADFNASATLLKTYTIGGENNSAHAATPGALYSNVTNFTGSGVTCGGATGLTATTGTNAIMDDTNLISSTNFGGGVLSTIQFSVANIDAAGAAITARVRVRFYDTTGAGGGPGTNIAAISFSPIAFAAGVSVFSSDFTSFAITLPQNCWAATFFDASTVTTGTTVAQLNELGVGTFNPPTVGTSADKDFLTNVTAPGSNPTGTLRNSPFTGAPVANYGWEFNATPEPASMAVIGMGVLAMLRRRNKKA